MFTVVVIALQPLYGALSDHVGRRPLNLFSVVFTAVWAFPFFLLLDTRAPVLIWLALIVAALVAQAGGKGWLVACWMILTALVSFAAFHFSRESKDMDIGTE